MKNKKALWRILVVAAVVVLAGALWFGRPRSPVDILGLRGQTLEEVQVIWRRGMNNDGTRATQEPGEMEAFLSALDELRFVEELHFGDTLILEGGRFYKFSVWTVEGGYAFFEFSSGDGCMVYSGAGASRSRVFRIVGDPGELTSLFDMADTWPATEN